MKQAEDKEPKKRHKKEVQRPTHSHTQEFHKNTKPEGLIYAQRTCSINIDI